MPTRLEAAWIGTLITRILHAHWARVMNDIRNTFTVEAPAEAMDDICQAGYNISIRRDDGKPMIRKEAIESLFYECLEWSRWYSVDTPEMDHQIPPLEFHR